MGNTSSSPEAQVSVRVLLPNAFQKHTNGTREIQSNAGNLPELITEIETSFPALKPHLRDNDGKVRRFINFYVNEEDIRFLGNEKYAFKDGDEVLVIPSIAGGSFAHGECCAHGESRFAPTRQSSFDCCSYCGREECLCC
jgi:molybdopterin synthase sulfur carrier subunit